MSGDHISKKRAAQIRSKSLLDLLHNEYCRRSTDKSDVKSFAGIFRLS